MWVRSQNKEVLINANNIRIGRGANFYNIVCIFYDGDYHHLGAYSTEEKALKVMDMIEEEIIKYEAMITVDSVSFYDRKVVFQMPSDDEVE